MCGVTLMQRVESTKGRKRMNQVSIIIPVHNTPEEYLRECLHSVLRQDYTNWEAILIDDGSAARSVSATNTRRRMRAFA